MIQPDLSIETLLQRYRPQWRYQVAAIPPTVARLPNDTQPKTASHLQFMDESELSMSHSKGSLACGHSAAKKH